MKVRIGVGTGAAGLDGPAVVDLAGDLVDHGLDSLWLPEVLTADGLDPLVALAWAGAAHPRCKLGTTMLLPGRNPVRLAKQVASLDALSGGRFLVTFVTGLVRGPERDAVGVEPGQRGAAVDELLPLLRRLWSGAPVSHSGPAGHFRDVTVSPRPAQEPFDVWLGGSLRSSLVRCGRLADGWLPSLCTPEEVGRGRRVVEAAAAEAGRSISPEHFGASVAYAREPLTGAQSEAIARRAHGRPPEELVPVGLPALADLIDRFVAVGFSKFVVRPLRPPDDWRRELDDLAGAVGHLQT